MKFRSLALGLAAIVALVVFAHFDHDAKVAAGLGLTGALCIGMVNQRTLQDANLSVTFALPAANASATSATIDTAEVNPGRLDDVELLITVPATPNLVDAHTVTLTLYHSADNNGDFVAVPDIPAQVITGAGGVGAAAFAYQCKLPINLARYVQLQAAVSNGGGSNIAVSATLAFVF